jgi:nitrate/TMAO reductase-like tetraheme cytochrome c subunit
MVTWMSSNPFLMLALGCAAIAVALLLWYLVRRPALDRATKIILLFGIGIFPIATATNGNVAGYQATKATRFCSSCHVMTPYGDDSLDRTSTSLAARHARNESFGHENCYACHADYGMFGTITTKLGGLRHVYEYTLHYRATPIEQFMAEVEIRRPFANATCIHCHSTFGPTWNQVGDHASTLEAVRSGTLSCASEGCHGPAHPFSKAAKHRAQARTEGAP